MGVWVYAASETRHALTQSLLSLSVKHHSCLVQILGRNQAHDTEEQVKSLMRELKTIISE